jgi:hypothetical protein
LKEFSELCVLDNFKKIKTEKLPRFSNEPVKTDFSKVKLAVLLIFEENFQIGRHLEFFQGHFLKTIAINQFTRTTSLFFFATKM